MKSKNSIKILSILFNLFFILHFINGQKDILFIGGGISASSVQSDSMLVDSLRSWGFNIHYMNDGDYLNLSETVYDGMDAIFFNESSGADKIRNFGPVRDNFPLPCVTLELGAFENDKNRWEMFTDSGGILVHTPSDTSDFHMKITNNSHYITNIYEDDQVVKWSSTTFYDVVPYVYHLKYNTMCLAKPIAPVGVEDAITMGVLDEGDFPNRMFYFGITRTFIHDGSEILATNDFFKIIKRGLEWVLKLDTSTVIQPECTAHFKYIPLPDMPSTGGITVQFQDSSVASSNITERSWDFGDDNSATNKNPYNFYNFYHNSPDSFLVSLTIQTDDDCSDTAYQYIIIGDYRPECNTDFNYKLDTNTNSSYYQFTDLSVSDNITSWYWNFGDGSSSNIQNPYTLINVDPGDSVKVCLKTESISGCWDSICYYVKYNPKNPPEYQKSLSREITFVICPNLIKKKAYIKINSTLLGMASFKILSNTGQSIETFSHNLNSSDNTIPIELYDYRPGLYYMIMKIGDYNKIIKFIIQK